jgi:HEPN domain-containing protein
MPSSSPYQENNYQALSTFRPYSLPVNDIAKAISAQNQFWWDGASKVKQQYQNALDLDLTLDENKTIRDNFLKEAEKQMTKLSAGNVADPSVQRQGLSIFKPLFQDRGILLDDQLTKKRQAIFSDAERFKNDEKTKGAGYNNDNLAYALRPFQGFGQTTSRADLEGVWGKAKDSQYTPYYDVSKERLDILKACKPTKASGTQVDDAYLRTSEVSSLSSQKLYGCLEGNMSGQAMQQLHISGVVRYGDNYQAVKDDYLAAAKDKHTQYSSEQAELLARKAALQKQAGTEDQVKDIDTQLKQYDTAIRDLDDDLTNINKWTPEYIQSNYEDLASTAFFRKANGSFAQAFAYKDIEESIKANPIWISNFVQGKLDERQQKEFTHDEQMQRDKEAADLKKALLTGKTKDGKEVSLLDRLKNPESLSTFPTAAIDDPNTPNTQLLKQQINSYDQNWKESVNTLMHHMYQVPGIKDAMDKLGIDVNKDRTQEQWTGFMRTLDTYVASHPDPTDDTKQEIIKAKNILTQYRNKKAQLQTVLDDATTQAKTKNPEIFQNEQEAKQKLYGSLTPLQFGNETLSPDRLRNIFEGKDASL